ncbi:MAG: DUF4276 family protein [Rhodoferax sp.]|nr:DUF4276 family protein [Betaproteobacteria bacterium]NCN95893.1 DUF4276 family protein [Rhodoferax sp.]OIP21713.1 MAG: hypothetical protein AUK50_00825 [Comamonadaceae bacterium CG2_30_57_122]PIZ22572.1 MAG: hypothetical protein COY49_07825 [Comamonadaceae bacterium CG_4_10_14_0_8_um_filter_57_29]PJC13554.1 MAG: hypothetical protein CO065_16080 [Comamonadaceae bacterium CG_4_9_14_0_8_um_filter_57_21]
MKRILVVGEDALCCALGERLVAAGLPGWQLARPSIDTKGVTKLVPALMRYVEQAKHVQPVLCIADTDGKCAVTLCRAWLPENRHDRFVLRLAHTEAESWLLADREGFAKALAVPLNKLPQNPDEESDPKRLVLSLVRRSKDRLFRNEVISAVDPSKPGTGYNLHLGSFVRTQWNARRGAQCSPSLTRALKRVQALDTIQG